MKRLMRVMAWCALCVVLLACQSAPAAPPAASVTTLPEGAIVIRNGRVIDGTGAEPIADGLVAINGEEIVAVGAETEYQVPEDARVIDAQGGSILPGFIDAHTHILGGNTVNSQAFLAHWLQAGVTTVRDLGSPYGTAYTTLSISALKEKLAAYGNGVPTIVVAGPIMTAPGGYPVSVYGRSIALEVADAEEARQGAERLLAEGADEIKIAIESGYPPTLSLEQVKAITEVAHRRGTRVSAHAQRAADAQVAIDGGVDDVAHMVVFGEMPDGLIQQMVEQDVWLEPTLAVVDAAVEWRLDDEEKKLFLELRMDNLRRYLAAGGKVAMGSDYGNPGIPLGMPMPELQRMVEFGMTPMDVIVASTSHAAEVCNLGEQVGTLEVGKQADVIVVRGNPLEDIQAMKDVFVVIKNGEVVVGL